MAGCVFAVSISSLSGPSNISRRRSKPRAALASSNPARAAGYASVHAWPMPTGCEPWPGKRNAIIGGGAAGRSPSQQAGTPGEAAAECRHEDEVALLDPARGERFLHGHVHRGRPGVAVPIDVDEHA